MYLREMRKLFKLIFLLIFPLCMYGQIKTFHTAKNIYFSHNILNESNTQSFDTIQQISIGPKFFGLSSFSNSSIYNSYLLGANLAANISKNFSIIADYDNLKGNHNLLITDYFDSLGVYPAFGKINTRFQFNIKYTLNKFFTIDAGKGKYFIGNGYRSLLLSSEHSPYPYFKLTTEFGRVKYYNLYTTFLDIQDLNLDRKKHTAIHFLDFELTENINIGIFDGVLWRSKDESYNRGFDVEYLNPIIFYRPVEFSKHSPDNILIGLNFNAKVDKTVLYGQILLDDLNISRQKDRDENYKGGFFQNKFAYQIGGKTNIRGISILMEYNQVQPYTYAHKEPMQTYTHLNQALAHPLGANFKEVVLITEYHHNKWNCQFKYTSARVGLDSLDTHYGQNIFVSDFEAEGDGQQYSYGNFNGQGVNTSINTLQGELAYSLKGVDIFALINYRTKKSDLIDQTFFWYSIGVRNFPFSTFFDY